MANLTIVERDELAAEATMRMQREFAAFGLTQSDAPTVTPGMLRVVVETLETRFVLARRPRKVDAVEEPVGEDGSGGDELEEVEAGVAQATGRPTGIPDLRLGGAVEEEIVEDEKGDEVEEKGEVDGRLADDPVGWCEVLGLSVTGPLGAVVLDLAMGKQGWRMLDMDVKEQVVVRLIRAAAVEGSCTLARFNAVRPGWMSTAEAQTMALGLRWSELEAKALGGG